MSELGSNDYTKTLASNVISVTKIIEYFSKSIVDNEMCSGLLNRLIEYKIDIGVVLEWYFYINIL